MAVGLQTIVGLVLRSLSSPPCVYDGQWVQAHPVEKRWYDHRRHVMRTERKGKGCPSVDAWEWRSRCPLPQWDVDEFCRLLGPNGTALFFGDSMNREWGFAILEEARGVPSCAGVRIRHVRTIHFDPWGCWDARLCVKPGNVRWVSVLGEWDLLVFNMGAHYVDDDVEWTRRHEYAAAAVAKRRKPGSLVIYRNTPFGHKGCESASAPFNSTAQAERYSLAFPFYHGNNFKRQNAIAEAVWRRHGFSVMDAYTVTVVRPDMHNAECMRRRNPEGKRRIPNSAPCAVHDCLRTPRARGPGGAAAHEVACPGRLAGSRW